MPVHKVKNKGALMNSQIPLTDYSDIVSELRRVFRFFSLSIEEECEGVLRLHVDAGASASAKNHDNTAYTINNDAIGSMPGGTLSSSGECHASPEAGPGHLAVILLAQDAVRAPELLTDDYAVLLAPPGARSPLECPPGVDHLLEYPPKLADVQKLLSRLERRSKRAARPEMLDRIVGSSAAMSSAKKLMLQAAASDANVLLLGESGSGKEIIARTIHDMSARRNGPFIAINCGAVPQELLESELFGHEKGAFTGAVVRRKGRFELASGGTLLLDEIGDMPLLMQVKLLRVLQERSFERVGGTQTINVNVRIIAATHQNLERKIADGTFRMDLYYRLNVFPIEVPPLRERREDIPLLVEAFQARMNAIYGGTMELDDQALAAIASSEFPGNVRELENLIERLAVLHTDERISNRHLPAEYRSSGDLSSVQLSEAVKSPENETAQLSHLSDPPISATNIDLKKHLADLERRFIESALASNRNVVAQAAKSLGLQRTTLVEKIKKLGVVIPDAVR